MVRIALVLALLAATALAERDCPGCRRSLVRVAGAQPTTAHYVCRFCPTALHVDATGRERFSTRSVRGRHAYPVVNGEPIVFPVPEAWLGHPATRPDHAIKRPSHPVKRPGHSVKRPAHAVKRPAHAVKRPSHAVQRPAHAVKRPSHSVTRPSHSVTLPAHAVKRPSHAVRRPGHAVRRPGHPVLRPGNFVVRHTNVGGVQPKQKRDYWPRKFKNGRRRTASKRGYWPRKFKG